MEGLEGSHLGLTNTCSQKGLGGRYGGRSCLSILGIGRCCRSSVSSGRLSPVSSSPWPGESHTSRADVIPAGASSELDARTFRRQGGGAEKIAGVAAWRKRPFHSCLAGLAGCGVPKQCSQAVGIPNSFALGCACPSLTPPLHPQKVGRAVVGKGGSLWPLPQGIDGQREKPSSPARKRAPGAAPAPRPMAPA